MKKILLSMAVVFAYAKVYDVRSLVDLQNTLIDIANINEDATINLANDHYDLDTTLLYTDDTTKTVTLHGNGATIDAHGKQAILVDNNLSTFVIDNLTIQNGETNESGGAILTNGSLKLDNITLKNNHAISGGAIEARSATIVNAKFINNSAIYGGAIDTTDDVTITNSLFTGNSAKYGGAIIAQNATISDSSFKNNSAEFGGAISTDSSVQITNSSFVGNSAVYGGAISTSTNSTISATLFQNNFATYAGAIIADSDITITNSVFLANKAKYSGAIAADNLTITNSTFLDNFASGYASAIYGSGTVTNTILLDKFDEIVLSGDMTIQNSIIDTGKIYQDTYSLTATNDYNYTKTQLGFIQDFRLASTSAAIDKGSSVAINSDYDGNARDSSPDIGASEYVQNPTIKADESKRLFITSLPSGWHLVSFDSDTYTGSSIFSNIQIVWVYRNGNWYAYAPDSALRQTLLDNGYTLFDTIKKEEGVWILK